MLVQPALWKLFFILKNLQKLEISPPLQSLKTVYTTLCSLQDALKFLHQVQATNRFPHFTPTPTDEQSQPRALYIMDLEAPEDLLVQSATVPSHLAAVQKQS